MPGEQKQTSFEKLDGIFMKNVMWFRCIHCFMNLSIFGNASSKPIIGLGLFVIMICLGITTTGLLQTNISSVMIGVGILIIGLGVGPIMKIET